MRGLMLYWVTDGALAVIVGGGDVAARKAVQLRRAGCRIRVVAPHIASEFPEIEDRRERAFDPADLEGAMLAFVATDDPGVNANAAREARARGVPVNVADDPALCDFYLPAVVHRGALAVAASTGGDCPGFAAFARRHLEQVVGDEWGRALDVVAAARRWARPRGVAWQPLLDDRLLDACRSGDRAPVDALLAGVLGPDASLAAIGASWTA